MHSCSQCSYHSREYDLRCRSCGSFHTLVVLPEDSTFRAERTRPEFAVRHRTISIDGSIGGESSPFSFQPSTQTSLLRDEDDQDEEDDDDEDDKPVRAIRADKLSRTKTTRISTGFANLDAFLGGGMVDGHCLLIGGDPGVGKSRLVTQIAIHRARQGDTILNFAAEEGTEEVKERLVELGAQPADLKSIFIQPTDQYEDFLDEVYERRPQLCIFDSIQYAQCDDVDGEAGSLRQCKRIAKKLSDLSHGKTIPGYRCVILVICHVDKSKKFAGPMSLQHAVDVLLKLQHDPKKNIEVSSTKNRRGAVTDTPLFRMTTAGLSPIVDSEESKESKTAKKTAKKAAKKTANGQHKTRRKL